MKQSVSNEIELLKFSLESAILDARRGGKIALSEVDVAYQKGLEDACAHILGQLNNIQAGKIPA